MTTPQEDTMTDPVADAARAVAARMAGEHGPGVAADVEAALAARGSDQRPGQYVDPVALGSLIVAVATLAWTIYADWRKQTSDPPPPAVVARQVRIELRQHASEGPHDTGEITEIVVTEMLRVARGQAGAPDVTAGEREEPGG
jgi:hypothetical protein